MTDGKVTVILPVASIGADIATRDGTDLEESPLKERGGSSVRRKQKRGMSLLGPQVCSKRIHIRGAESSSKS